VSNNAEITLCDGCPYLSVRRLERDTTNSYARWVAKHKAVRREPDYALTPGMFFVSNNMFWCKKGCAIERKYLGTANAGACWALVSAECKASYLHRTEKERISYEEMVGRMRVPPVAPRHEETLTAEHLQRLQDYVESKRIAPIVNGNGESYYIMTQ